MDFQKTNVNDPETQQNQKCQKESLLHKIISNLQKAEIHYLSYNHLLGNKKTKGQSRNFICLRILQAKNPMIHLNNLISKNISHNN